MPLRPRFHLTAPHAWLNDPNGLWHRDGTWHAYYQTNPLALHWGNMSWGHATSSDLLHWHDQPLALRFLEATDQHDGEQAFSGSVVGDRQGLFGPSDDGLPALVAIYTAHRTDRRGVGVREAQALAVSHDGGQSFHRHDDNPVLDRGSTDFRDPKVFWYSGPDSAGHWVMVAVEAELRQVLVHVSDDLVHWELVSTLGPLPWLRGIWECPDLIAITDPATGDAAWVLLVSVNAGAPCGGSGTAWLLGSFDGRRFTPDPVAHGWLDAGPDCYATVSYHEPPRIAGRDRVLVQGWASNALYAADTPTVPDGFRHCLTLPRELSLDAARRRPRLEIPSDVLGAFADAEPVTRLRDGSLDLVEPCGVLQVTCRGEVHLQLDGLAVHHTDRGVSVTRVADGNLPTTGSFAMEGGVSTSASSFDVVIDACIVEVFVDGQVLTFTRFPDAAQPPVLRGEAEVLLRRFT